MNKSRLYYLIVALFAVCNFADAQVHLKIEPITGAANTYGVYAKVCENISPSSNTITGSGQVTIKFPTGLSFSNLTSHGGTWMQNAMVINPPEAPGKVYASVGFLSDSPHIFYFSDSESLLFTFKLNGSVTTAPELIANGVDPFDQLPNSASSNPGNELTVLDFGVQPLGLYTYTGNFSGNALDCSQVPQDTTTIITPPGDTTTQDTTIITPPGDTTTQDTTIVTPPGDTTTQDTTIITPPGDTTQQTSSVRNLTNEAGHFTIYPTPAYEWVTVKFADPTTEGGTIRLYNLNGISFGEIKRGQKQEVILNVSGLTSGMYLIIYEKGGKTLQRDKFLKQ